MTWAHRRLEGRIVTLEPLSAGHEEALWEASRDPATWRWLSIVQPATREEWRRWLEDALGEPGHLPFATVLNATGRPAGSTRFLNLRPRRR